MKKLIIISLSVIFSIALFSSCAKDCKNCHSVKTEDATGTVVTQGTDSEYCDTDLDAKENEEPSTVGGYTTKWVCE